MGHNVLETSWSVSGAEPEVGSNQSVQINVKTVNERSTSEVSCGMTSAAVGHLTCTVQLTV